LSSDLLVADAKSGDGEGRKLKLTKKKGEKTKSLKSVKNPNNPVSKSLKSAKKTKSLKLGKKSKIPLEAAEVSVTIYTGGIENQRKLQENNEFCLANRTTLADSLEVLLKEGMDEIKNIQFTVNTCTSSIIVLKGLVEFDQSLELPSIIQIETSISVTLENTDELEIHLNEGQTTTIAIDSVEFTVLPIEILIITPSPTSAPTLPPTPLPTTPPTPLPSLTPTQPPTVPPTSSPTSSPTSCSERGDYTNRTTFEGEDIIVKFEGDPQNLTLDQLELLGNDFIEVYNKLQESLCDPLQRILTSANTTVVSVFTNHTNGNNDRHRRMPPEKRTTPSIKFKVVGYCSRCKNKEPLFKDISNRRYLDEGEDETTERPPTLQEFSAQLNSEIQNDNVFGNILGSVKIVFESFGLFITIPCLPGSFHDESSNYDCKSCPDGEYQTYFGQTSCNECAPGNFVTAYGTLCLPILCLPGQYMDANDGYNCKNCPKFTYRTLPSSEQSCEFCPSPRITVGRVTCQSCPSCSKPNSNRNFCDFCGFNWRGQCNC